MNIPTQNFPKKANLQSVKKRASRKITHPDRELIYGWHTIHTLLKEEPERIIQLYLWKDRHDQRSSKLIELAQEKEVHLIYLDKESLNKRLPGLPHQGVAALWRPKRFYETDLDSLLAQWRNSAFLLILDGIQDPHNLGACLRSAQASGVQAIITSRDRCCGITPVTRKIACGAAEKIPFVQVTNLARILRQLKEKDIWIYGMLSQGGQSLYQTKLNQPLAIVIGEECQGLRRLTREYCDAFLTIPLKEQAESLNLSVATGIVLFEVIRQKQTTN